MRLTRYAAAMTLGLASCLLFARGDEKQNPAAPAPAKGNKTAGAPAYDARGNLKLPEDFKTWVFVGSSLGLDYRSDVSENTTRAAKPHDAAKVGDFHNVYINPGAYEHYIATGKFPDQTVLVMDVYAAQDKEPRNIVLGGHFAGARRAVEVAVKNSNRPDGSKTAWAYYAFPMPRTTKIAKAFKDATCFECHKQHADDDNVWVQFYPTLRDLKSAKKP
jgi:hypothetical protein